MKFPTIKLIALTACVLAIFGDVTPGSGHLLAIVSSVLAAFCFAGAPIIAASAVGANAMAVTLPTPELVIYDMMHYSTVPSRLLDIDPVPWQYGIHFLIVVFGLLRYWDARQKIAYA